MEIVRIPIDEITPDPMNAKDHPDWQVEQIEASIEQFGNLDPIGVWGDDNLIVEGHGRYEALKALGYQEAECIRLDWLSEEERRAYALAHNKLTMNSGWIPEALDLNLDAIGEIDMSLFGFRSGDWFKNRERYDNGGEQDEEYQAFVEKFEPKRTTDDCYTPDLVYEAVAEWVANEYGLDRKNFVRPFYPGGDYKKERYKKDAVVVDNPPFSILSEILSFYAEEGVHFFLFGPTLTLFSSSSSCCAIPTGASVVYENGASVNTSFLTNLEPEDLRVRTAPALNKAVQDANDEEQRQNHAELPKYLYPDNVITSAMVARWSKYGIEYRLTKAESAITPALDAQKEVGKAIFGKGYLISKRAAAERAAAERAAATRWQLSDREWAIIEGLGGENDAG